MSRGALVIVGGYGLVGAQAAEIVRRRHPDLPLVLAGRNPERGRPLARRLDATLAQLDVTAPRPLASLPERPAAVLASVSDPGDRLVVDAMRRDIPFADINRGGHAAVLDVAVAATAERSEAPVLLSGSWLAGVTALCAAAVTRALGGAERLDLCVLASSDDRIGEDAWGFSRRMPWPYHVMHDGERHPVPSLSGVRRERCADGITRLAARVSTLDQVSLPVTLGVPTVETRMALHSQASMVGLVALARSGLLRLLDGPRLRGVADPVLRSSGTGDLAGLTVRGRGPAGTAAIEVLSVRGQSHLSAIGAALAAERILGFGTAALPGGLCFPEQFAEPAADLAALRAAGATVRLHGLVAAPQPDPALPKEELTV